MWIIIFIGTSSLPAVTLLKFLPNYMGYGKRGKMLRSEITDSLSDFTIPYIVAFKSNNICECAIFDATSKIEKSCKINDTSMCQ